VRDYFQESCFDTDVAKTIRTSIKSHFDKKSFNGNDLSGTRTVLLIRWSLVKILLGNDLQVECVNITFMMKSL
jgi:hypothetical protein